MASRLYWFVIDDDETKNKIRYHDFVYIVHRPKRNLEFAYATMSLAKKCASRLKGMYPEEAESISINRLEIRTEYK